MSGAITVGELLERAELGVTAVAGSSGLGRTVTVPRIQKPGLALTGWPEQLHANRVLVLGGTEIEYLADHERSVGIQTVLASDPACIVICRGLDAPEDLHRACEERGVPLLSSTLVTAYAAWRGDTLAGTAIFDTRVVRTMPAVLMVVIAPDTSIARVDVLAFHEPTDFLPSKRWFALLERERLDDRLWPGRDIRTISGMTLSTRAVAEAVRQALAVYQVAVVKELAAR